MIKQQLASKVSTYFRGALAGFFAVGVSHTSRGVVGDTSECQDRQVLLGSGAVMMSPESVRLRGRVIPTLRHH